MPSRAASQSPAVPRELGVGCWHCVPLGSAVPSPECPVPSPACLLPKALQAVAEVLPRKHPALLPTACQGNWDLCNQSQPWLLHCK